MTGKYTADELNKSIEETSSSLQGVVRGVSQSADDIVDSIKDYIFRTLNSDIDSVYALIALLRNKEVITCTEVLSNIEDVIALLPATQAEKSAVSEDDLENLQDLLEELVFAPEGQRAELVDEFQKGVDELARKNKTSTGATLSGTGRDAARAQVQSLCRGLSVLVASLQVNGQAFADAIRSYMLANFEDVSASIQAKSAQTTLSKHSNDEDQDAQQILLDSAVAASLVTQANQPKRDITIPKYEGPVTTLPGLAAFLYGGTDPFIIQGDLTEEANFVVDGTEAAKLVGDASGWPAKPGGLKQEWTGPLVTRADSGEYYNNAGESFAIMGVAGSVQSGEVPTDINGDPVIGPLGTPLDALKYFKDIVVPGSVTGIASQYDPPSDPVPYIIRDIAWTANNPWDGGVLEYKRATEPSDPWDSFGIIDYITGTIRIDDLNLGDYSFTYEYFYLGDLVYRSGGTEASFVVGNADLFVREIEIPINEFSVIGHNWLCRRTLNPDIFSEWWYPGGLVDTDPADGVPDNSAHVLKPHIVTGADIFSDLLRDGEWVEASDEFMGQHIAWTDQNKPTPRWTLFKRNGTAHRLTYPKEVDLLGENLNTSPFGPKWYAQPSLNSLARRTFEEVGNIYGTDTPASTLVETGPIDVDVPQKLIKPAGNNTNTVTSVDALDDTGEAIDKSYIEMPFDLIEVGDDIYDSVSQSHAKVVAVGLDAENTTQTDGITIYPAFARAPDLSDPLTHGVAPDATHKVKVTRHRVRVTSQTNESTSRVAVADNPPSGLGFTDAGSAMGTSLAISLGQTLDLENVVTAPGYNIKPRDVILEKTLGTSRPIGRVETVNGNRITVLIYPEGTTYNYPFTSLLIVALGWHRHVSLKADLLSALDGLKKVSPSELISLANTTSESGSGQGQFTAILSQALTSVAALRNAYLLYEAHTVNTVNKMMSHLNQEKMTVLHDLLATSQFSAVPDINPEAVSSKGDVEGMLGAAVDLIGQGVDFIDIARGYDPLTDFAVRSKEQGVVLEELPDDDFIP